MRSLLLLLFAAAASGRRLVEECPTIYVVAPFGVPGAEQGRGFSRRMGYVDARIDNEVSIAPLSSLSFPHTNAR